MFPNADRLFIIPRALRNGYKITLTRCSVRYDSMRETVSCTWGVGLEILAL